MSTNVLGGRKKRQGIFAKTHCVLHDSWFIKNTQANTPWKHVTWWHIMLF